MGGGGDAGEAHRQVVDRLEEPPGARRHLRLGSSCEVEHVADRVGTAQRRGTAGSAHPGQGRPRRVARQPAADNRAATRGRRGCPSRGCSRRPARRARRPARCSPTARSPRPPRPPRGRPPPRRDRVGSLRRSAPTTPRRPARRRRRPASGSRRAGGHARGSRLRAGRSRPSGRRCRGRRRGQTPSRPAAGVTPGRACIRSSMSAITERMNSSASSVMPPGDAAVDRARRRLSRPGARSA